MQKDHEPGIDHSKPGKTSKQFIITVVMATLLMLNVKAQNLIPNPGFESYKFLPCSCMQKNVDAYLKGWERVGAGTPDYINAKTPISCYANTQSNNWESCGSEIPHK